MGYRINEPGNVEADGGAQKYAPQHSRNSQRPSAQGNTTSQQHDGGESKGQPVPDGESAIESIPLKIGCVVGEHRCFTVQRAAQNPAHVRPPFTIAGRVWIAGYVGVLVMQAMHGDPVDRAALQRQRAAGCQAILQTFGRSEAAMRKLAVVADGNTHILAQQPQDKKHSYRRPAKAE